VTSYKLRVTSGRSIDFKLYLITDRKILSGTRDLFEAVEDALRAGIKAVQLREKDLPIRELLDMAYRMRELTGRYGARLLVNDRVDVAMCVEADGVHLGQSAIPVCAVRNMVDKKFMIGASTHNLEEAVTAEKEGADFVTFGPLYQTPSKRKYGEPVGIEALRGVRKKLSIPIFGIGGIKTDNVRDVINSGAHGIALISGILGESDVRTATEKYLRVIEEINHRDTETQRKYL
jgi:thiamine-phosphate pyrophosphorylase